MLDLPGLEGLYVSINGRMSPANEAKVSVFDRGVMYGDGIYEGLRVVGGNRIYKLAEHLNRLDDSARTVAIELPYTHEVLTEQIAEVVKASNLDEGHVRVIVTRGPAEPGLDPRLASKPTTIIMAYSFSKFLRPGSSGSGLTAKLAAIRRMSPEMVDPKAKSLNYLNEILAQLEAIAAGCNTAILFGIDGYLAEASAANLFLVRHGVLYTPYPNHCLSGITRSSIMDLAGSLGYAVHERNLTYADLFNADEVFLTSTAVDVSPIIEVDKRKIGAGTVGKITSQLKTAFIEQMKETSTVLF